MATCSHMIATGTTNAKYRTSLPAYSLNGERTENLIHGAHRWKDGW